MRLDAEFTNGITTAHSFSRHNEAEPSVNKCLSRSNLTFSRFEFTSQLIREFRCYPLITGRGD